jgi:hypothetical protein
MVKYLYKNFSVVLASSHRTVMSVISLHLHHISLADLSNIR